MEERSELIDVSDSRSPSKRRPEEVLDEQPKGGKRLKMREIDSVLRCGGLKKCSKFTEAKAHMHQSKEEETSQITDTLHSDKPVELMISNSSIEPTNGICSSLGLVDSVKSSENLISNVAHTITDEEHDAPNMTLADLSLDLNENPFHPYKMLGQVRSVDASECGSTTGPLEGREPLRVWKEMKQNGFLSSSHGSIPANKQQGRQPKRKKEEEFKKKSDMTKGEQPNKYTKIAAPTGLLAGLNPGIIKHVRNSKQVNSIIEAMLQSEKRERQMQNRPTDQLGSGSKDVAAHNSAGNPFNQFNLYLSRASFLSSSEHGGQISGPDITVGLYHESSTIPRFNPEYDDDSLTLKLSSAVTMASENARSTSNDELSASHDNIASLSWKGASVASQWLDLLRQDIKGRLAALRRSKKRVRNVIHTKLPYLLSKEILSNQENEGYSSEGGCSKKAILDMHMARWKSIFSQMDKALYEEGKRLENWLKQVQDMHSHCEAGLTYLDTNRKVLPAEESSELKKTEAVERENAVRAAAASIYSTCNFITTKENVPCF